MPHFGSAVAHARRRRNWSQRKLAMITGLSRSFINDIERGRSTGTLRTWITLARALELSLDEIFLQAEIRHGQAAAAGSRKKGS